jgi:hypothetical protein
MKQERVIWPVSHMAKNGAKGRATVIQNLGVQFHECLKPG